MPLKFKEPKDLEDLLDQTEEALKTVLITRGSLEHKICKDKTLAKEFKRAIWNCLKKSNLWAAFGQWMRDLGNYIDDLNDQKYGWESGDYQDDVKHIMLTAAESFQNMLSKAKKSIPGNLISAIRKIKPSNNSLMSFIKDLKSY